jgi:hypothetical protein
MKCSDRAAAVAPRSCVFCLFTCGIIVGCGSWSPTVLLDRGDGLGAQSFADHLSTPACPDVDKKNKVDGLVVIEIQVNPRGTVTKATALQYPDFALSTLASESAAQARFRVPSIPGAEKGLRATGRLFYYFRCSSAPFRAMLPSEFPSRRP